MRIYRRNFGSTVWANNAPWGLFKYRVRLLTLCMYRLDCGCLTLSVPSERFYTALARVSRSVTPDRHVKEVRHPSAKALDIWARDARDDVTAVCGWIENDSMAGGTVRGSSEQLTLYCGSGRQFLFFLFTCLSAVAGIKGRQAKCTASWQGGG